MVCHLIDEVSSRPAFELLLVVPGSVLLLLVVIAVGNCSVEFEDCSACLSIGQLRVNLLPTFPKPIKSHLRIYDIVQEQ